MNTSETVSVIIPCYNHAKYLSDAIESVLNQTHQCEIIVVNDGSTDNSLEVAQNYPVKIVNQTNMGLSSARNNGIKLATGKWIITLDSDDKIVPEYVEKCLLEAQKKSCDIVGTNVQFFGKRDNVWRYLRLSPVYDDFLKYNRLCATALFKKEIWEAIGGYDECMKLGYEDWDFWIRATQLKYKVSVIPEFLFYYRKHEESMYSESLKKHSEIIKYMKTKSWEKQLQIPENYIQRKKPLQYFDMNMKDEWQKEVYLKALHIFESNKYESVIDLGCGSAYKLLNYFPKTAKLIGVEEEITYEWLRETYQNGNWTKWQSDLELEPFDLLICSDVIEHIVDVFSFMDWISKQPWKKMIMSTPDRSLLYNKSHIGPPRNESHVREWTFEEFKLFVSQWFIVEEHTITNESQTTQAIVARKS